jgi:hypothetical protein
VQKCVNDGAAALGTFSDPRFCDVLSNDLVPDAKEWLDGRNRSLCARGGVLEPLAVASAGAFEAGGASDGAVPQVNQLHRA